MTQSVLNGFRVDFYWPDYGLWSRRTGSTYHRTPAEQARDRFAIKRIRLPGSHVCASPMRKCVTNPHMS